MSPGRSAPEPDAVTFEIEIAAPPEQVFRALTDPRQLFTWWGAEPSVDLLTFDMDARPGGSWGFRCRAVAGHDHGAVGEQLRAHGSGEFEAHGQVLHRKHRHRVVRGSRTSRKPSPSRLNESEHKKIASPGYTARRGACER